MRASLRQARVQRRVGLGLACGALISLAVVLVRNDGDKDAAAVLTSVVSAVVSICAFAADLLREPGDGGAQAPVDRRRQAADALAEAVGEQWSAEARRRRLPDPAPLNVRWSRVGPPLADQRENIHRERAVPPPRDGDQRLDQVVTAFTALPSRRLVVLGEPGAGKSVLAVQFVRGMIEARQPGDAVPVLFPLAGWDPWSTPLRDWLAERLAAEYRPLAVPSGERTLARELLDASLVLPVLDGFDELPEPAYGKAMERLNAALDDRLPVLLTCRTAAWSSAVGTGVVLRAAEVVKLRPLDFTAAREYLERTAQQDSNRSTRWTPVLAAPSAPLAEALDTPLMVALARTIYGDTLRDPRDLNETGLFPTAQSIEEHLLEAFVPAAFGDETGSPWRPETAHRWLLRLARDLDCHDQEPGTWRLAWWELPGLMPRMLRVIGPAVVALLATAAVLVPLAEYGGGVVGDWDSPLSTVLNFAGIFLGLCFGLAFLLPARAGGPRRPGQLGRMVLTLASAATVIGVASGVLVPPLTGLRFGDVITPGPAWFLNGCCFGLILSMMFAVAGLPRQPLPMGLPWAGSPGGRGAVRALGTLVAFAGPVLLVTVREVVPAVTCLVSGLLLCLAGQPHGERVTTRYTGPLAVLRGFGKGLVRGFLICLLVGVSTSAVVGGVMGSFAAYEIHSTRSPMSAHVIDGWRTHVQAGGVRTVTSTRPYRGELLLRAGEKGDLPLAVPRGAGIAYNGRRAEHFEDVVRVSMESDGPVLITAGGRKADAWNVVLELPPGVRLWLAQRSTLVVIREAVVPLAGFGVLIGVIGGCASGVYRALSTPSDTMRAASPMSTLRTDRAATLARSSIAAMLAGGVVLGLILVVGRGSSLGTMHTELWVPVGTAALALSAWGRLGVARVWLAVTGRAPWRLMRFLEEAHRRGVLRQSGAHYEFRHLRLQQSLARAAENSGVPQLPSLTP